MDFVCTWIDNIMGTIALCPKLFQFCVAFFSGTGFLGCNLAAFSNVWNAFHCCFQEIGMLDRLVSPLVSLMQGDKQ